MKTQDRSFDGIAKKFEENIYGTTKGRLRHEMLTTVLAKLYAEHQSINVLDLGGGTGVMAHTFLQWGHKVDVVDTSEDVLNLAKEKLTAFADEGKVNFYKNSIQDFSIPKKYDLVICHAVLEWLSEPLDCLANIVCFMQPKGRLSLSFFNQDAKLFGNMVYGNFDYIEKGMQVKNQVKLNPQNPLTIEEVEMALQKLDKTVEQRTGIRCFHDYMKEPLTSEQEYQQLLALEKRYCQQAPFYQLGKYIHLLVK